MPDELITASGEADLFGPLAPFLGGYKPQRGVRDEMIDERGAVRPHWRAFIEALAGLGYKETSRRFDLAARQMREADVFYRVFEAGGAARPWPMSASPLIVSAQEWTGICEGLVQRAALLEAVLADAYGPQKLIADGSLPAAVIAGSPEFLRPLVGAAPRGGRFLRFYAADLGRGPDGSWWVIGDRAQAPSGAGYALENRIVLSRALPDVIRDLEVERLAGFFGAFRSALQGLANPDSTRVCVLTPGPLSETYFEHAYLARYLGFLLVEGEDLTVRDNEVYLRTVAGLRRADVLLRRLDADFADPLELNAASRIGAPGLVRAARAGNVAIANALGAGLVESRALMSFLPALAQKVLGEKLKLPNIATWWCGQQAERDAVIAGFDSMAIAPAFSAAGPEPFQRGAVPGAGFNEQGRAAMIDALQRRGVDFVGQEIVRLSTAPVWRSGRFEPRPFVLRVFVAATDDGWTVMPGGFCRVSEDFDPRAVSMQHGGCSADVWVLSDRPVEPTTLLPAPDEAAIQRQTSTLTSRAADNLFWLGRYLERAEMTLRLVRALAGRASERGKETRNVVDQLAQLLVAWGAAPKSTRRANAPLVMNSALASDDQMGAARALVRSARTAAAAIRDRLSPDAWRTISDLSLLLDDPHAAPLAESDAHERADSALRILAAFSGFAQENMTRANGWRFLEIGRRVERAIAVSRFVRALAIDAASAASIDALLELGDSQITYAQRYFLTASRPAAVDLLVLDPSNPRSCVFQVERLRELVDLLPGHQPGELLTHCQRLIERCVTELHVTDAGSIDADFMLLLEEALMALSDGISERFLINRDRVAGGPAKADE